MKKSLAKLKNTVYDAAAILAGALLFSASVNMFIVPGKIILGGATGIASVIGSVFDLPVGVLIVAVNIPLVLINLKYYGIKFLFKTVIGVALTSAATDLITFFPVTISDPMLCALFGGMTMGAGTGLLFSRGYTTGGTDLAALFVRRKRKDIGAGRVIMICDFVIISVLTLVTKEYVGIIYSLVATYAYSVVTDTVIDGADCAKSVFIISECHREIASDITEKLERGVTVLDGRGFYTNEEKNILLCVAKKSELYELKKIIRERDDSAFVFFCDTSDVIGYGFEKH